MTRRIGLLGGTFDPIHCGHLDAAGAADAALGLSELWAVPSHIPPHRTQPDASGYHRFAMVALAIAGRPRWRASDIELIDAAPSFTSATLGRLHDAGYAPTELFFIVGADAFADIAGWRDYPAVVDRAHFVVISRSGLTVTELSHRLPALAPRMTTPSSSALRLHTPAIFLIDAVTADVSSTMIRSRCAAGQPIAGLVPAAVEQYIQQQGLYANTRPDANASNVGAGPTAGRLHGQN
jgi:nicotinate-nucleotide adenylyltransferase